jgi:hypothetical protein
VAELNRQFAELALGFVDAVVAIAEARGLPRTATTDPRDFTARVHAPYCASSAKTVSSRS